MVTQDYTNEQVAERGEALYQRDIRSKVDTAENFGKYVVVDIESGDYEVAAERIPAIDRLRLRRPDGTYYILRVGFRAAASLGGGRRHLDR
jgi:hypothetical protein